jgi:lipopolysaccharide transport system permease protein
MTDPTTQPATIARRHGSDLEAGFELTGGPVPLRSLVGEAWDSRSLIMILAKKDFFVRYRRATFGLLWAAALPVLQALVLSFVVSKFARFDTEGGYAVFVLSGMVGWAAFSGTLAVGSTSIVDGSGLSTKIYFPRLVFPLVSTATSAYGLGISVVVLLLATIISGEGVGAHTLYLVPAVALTLTLAGSCALVLSALHVYFRDVRYLVQAALLVWLYLTPVIYPLEVLGGAQRYVEANPMTGVVELYRAATVGADPGWPATVLWSCGWCALLLVAGLVLHRRFDRVFADLL